ncbi:MAG TPA: PP2C family protein-serine/threonine phosphatase [Candidatus Limnocylindrales bacterium]|jgi:serine phosphatase RsbU (regulator of sigma subunit)
MTQLDDLLADASLASLLALASAAADGADIGITDPDGRLLAGRSVRSVAARRSPVTMDGEVVGLVVGEERVAAELTVLVGCALEMALAGARVQADRARVAQELSIGKRIQQALLPRRYPDVPGWTFAARYEPAREVGGDLFDLFPVRGGTDRIALVIADVTGKGIPAAVLMADVKGLLHSAIDNTDAPAEALRRVNSVLVIERQTPLFVTAALLVIDVATGAIRYALAGHEPPLVARRVGRVEALASEGPILGAFADPSFEEHETALEPGDAVTLYTDGITDARDMARRFYGEDRLLALVGGACGRPAETIAEAIVADVTAFRGDAEPFDDLTLLVAERRPG